MYVHVRGGQKNGSLVAKRRYFDDVPNAMFFLSTKPCQRPHSGLCCADQNSKCERKDIFMFIPVFNAACG